MDRIDKPLELLAAREAAETLFETLQRWFEVPSRVTLELSSVTAANREIRDVHQVMALAMRRLQALHVVSGPRVITTTDVVLTIVQDLERPLRQAPRLRLRREAARTDWDAELAALEEQMSGEQLDEASDPVDVEMVAEGESESLLDEEVRRFTEAHNLVRKAAKAVIQASDGKIRRLG